MLLKKKGVDFEDVSVDSNGDLRDEIERRSGRRTVPQIFIDDESIGGFDELYALEQDGELDRLIDTPPSAEKD